MDMRESSRPKLATSLPRVRLVVHPGRVEAVLGGVFPPERAPARRHESEALRVFAEPRLLAAVDRFMRDETDRLLGNNILDTPRGWEP